MLVMHSIATTDEPFDCYVAMFIFVLSEEVLVLVTCFLSEATQIHFHIAQFYSPLLCNTQFLPIFFQLSGWRPVLYCLGQHRLTQCDAHMLCTPTV